MRSHNPPRSGDDDIASHHDGLGIACVGTVCLVVWRQAVTLPRFERQRAALIELSQRHPNGVAFLCVIGENVPPPDGELRKATIEMVTALGSRLRCIACVIEGEGFRAATTRGVLSGMSLLLRSNAPAIRVAASVGESAAWLTQHYGAIGHEIVDGHGRLMARMAEST